MKNPFEKQKPAFSFKRTLIAVPTTGTLLPAMVNDLISLICHSRNWRTFHTVDNCVIQDARNQAVKRMYENDCDGILFIDSDQTFPNTALETLIETHKDIVGYPIIRKAPPYYPNISRFNEETKDFEIYEDYPKNNLFKVAYIGMGFVYIRRAVFEAMDKKFGDHIYFDFGWYESDKYKKGDKMIGEDVFFCMRAKECGFDIWVNPFVKIGHIGNFCYTPELHENYARVLAKAEVKKDGKG